MAAIRSITSQAGGSTFNANTTQYIQYGGSMGSKGTTEANLQTIQMAPGVLANLFVYITTNTLSNSSTWRTRVNAANGAQSVSISAAATGVFEDTSNTDTVAAADKINYQAVNIAGGTSIITSQVGCTFTAITNTVKKFVTTNTSAVTNANTTFFVPLQGNDTRIATVEANVRYKSQVAGTLSNMAVHISANARTTNTLVRSRKNGANGNLLVTVPNGATGFFEDTTNSDTITAGDFINYTFTLGSSLQSITCNSVAAEFTTTADSFIFLAGSGSTNNINAGATSWGPVDGLSTATTNAEAQTQNVPRIGLVAANLGVYIVANTASTAGAAMFRQNGANTTLTVSITASTTGLYEDTTHTVNVAATDLINYEYTGGATGSFTFSVIGITAAVAAGVTVTPGVASLTTTSYLPTVTATNAQSVTPSTASLTISLYAPTVSTSVNVVVTPGLQTLTTTLYAPDVISSDNQSVTPDVASLVLTTFDPLVSNTNGIIVWVDTATLTLTPQLPAGGATGVVAYPDMIFDIDGNALKRVTTKLYMKI